MPGRSRGTYVELVLVSSAAPLSVRQLLHCIGSQINQAAAEQQCLSHNAYLQVCTVGSKASNFIRAHEHGLTVELAVVPWTAADVGGFHKAYELSNYGLAGEPATM